MAKTSLKHSVEPEARLVSDEIERYSNVLMGVVKLTKSLSDGR